MNKSDDDVFEQLVRKTIELYKAVEAIVLKDKERDEARDSILKIEAIMQNSRRWGTLRDAIGMLEILKNSPREFMKRKNDYTKRLAGEAASESTIKDKNALEIASMIAKITLASPETTTALKELLVILKKFLIAIGQTGNAANAFNEFRVRLKEYEDRYNALLETDEEQKQNKRTILEIIAQLKNLADENEVYYLSAYGHDIEAWPQYAQATTERISFFSRRVDEYIQGTEQATTSKGVKIRGLVSRFKDIKLWKLIDSNDAIKNLRTYSEQIVFYDEMRQLIQSAAGNKDWEGEFTAPDGKKIKMPFLGPKGFFHNLDKGRNFIGMVRNHFGNHVFANDIERIKKEAGEQPVIFLQELAKLETILKNPQHQISVIHAAMQELSRIFMLRISHLAQEMEKRVSEEEKKIAKIIRSLGGEHETAVKTLTRVLARIKLKMYREWKKQKERYEEPEKLLVVDFFDASQEANNVFSDVLQLKDRKKRYMETVNRELEASRRLSGVADSISANSQMTLDEIPKIFDIFAGNLVDQSIIDRAKQEYVRLAEDLETDAKESIPLINEHIQKAELISKRYDELRKIRDEIRKSLDIQEVSRNNLNKSPNALNRSPKIIDLPNNNNNNTNAQNKAA